MHVEVTRMITLWLQHEAFGVEAMLAQVHRKKSPLAADTDEDPEPKLPYYYNDVDSEDIDESPLGIVPPRLPGLIIVSDGATDTTDTEGQSSAQFNRVILGVGYYSDAVKRAQGIRDGNYTLEAVKKSLNRFRKGENSAKYRELNGFRIVKIRRMEIERVAGGVGASALVAMLFATLEVQDKAP